MTLLTTVLITGSKKICLLWNWFWASYTNVVLWIML